MKGFTSESLDNRGFEYGSDYGICDICDGAELWDELTPDWDGETGNHFSCESEYCGCGNVLTITDGARCRQCVLAERSFGANWRLR